MSLDAEMSRGTEDHRLIYYEILQYFYLKAQLYETQQTYSFYNVACNNTTSLFLSQNKDSMV